MRIKKSPCGAGCGVIFLRYGVGMAAGGEGRGAAPAAPCGGRREACRRHAAAGGTPAGLRPGSRTLQRAAQRKPPRTTAARGELLCRDQSVMGVKTLSLLVSATMSER